MAAMHRLTPLLASIAIFWLQPAQATPPTSLSAGCSELTIGEVIEFQQNSTRIRRRDRALLASLAPLLHEGASPILLLSIEGYQDPEERTEDLALQRALAVQDELLSLGAHPSRLVPLGHDTELWPRADGDWSDRRVEFDILLPGTCDSAP